LLLQTGCLWGSATSFTERIDKNNEWIGILLCCICEPSLGRIEMSKEAFYETLAYVSSMRKREQPLYIAD
jgi:hypothetical protein